MIAGWPSLYRSATSSPGRPAAGARWWPVRAARQRPPERPRGVAPDSSTIVRSVVRSGARLRLAEYEVRTTETWPTRKRRPRPRHSSDRSGGTSTRAGWFVWRRPRGTVRTRPRCRSRRMHHQTSQVVHGEPAEHAPPFQPEAIRAWFRTAWTAASRDRQARGSEQRNRWTWVSPSSTATSRSSNMPVEQTAEPSRSTSARPAEPQPRRFSTTSVGPTVVSRSSPASATASTISSRASMAQPPFRSRRGSRPAPALSRRRPLADLGGHFGRSTVSNTCTSSTSSRTLLVCSHWPMKCTLAAAAASRLADQLLSVTFADHRRTARTASITSPRPSSPRAHRSPVAACSDDPDTDLGERHDVAGIDGAVSA